MELAPLLERHVDRSPFHTPIVAAIVHKYSLVLALLLDNKMQLTPEVAAEHLLLSPAAQLAGRRRPGQLLPSGREFVREPRPGETESVSLLMCAASVGNSVALHLLLEEGAVPCHLTAIF